jgi:hypothetical protein
VTIEKSGSLYSVNPANGAWKTVGKAAWIGTIAAIGFDGALYSTERNGALYRTNGNGKWVQLGKPDFKKTAFMVNVGHRLFTIERDGSLYAVQTK